MQDGKITRNGHFLRQAGLDELAQIFNILRGEMSVVGLRPGQAAIAKQQSVP
ncbi:MAG: sugar transferase [Candidatus Thiothrix singaporensis]|uniref:Sugar transferase n=1 Tax=Candidatus Thiothrix singaporensis TaxID=2799669 RepID=A0A7L6AWP1_9GAMM|nr:MAG: sugar transferase [Candidatus Thiothrix singaporensis]